MAKYTCKTCQKVFSQKGHLEDHNNRKRPCKKDNTIEALVEKKIQEALSKTNKGAVKIDHTPTSLMQLNQMDYSKNTREELIAICKEKSIKGYSGKKKEDIITLLTGSKNVVLPLHQDIIHLMNSEEGLQNLPYKVHLTVTSPPYFNVKDYVSYESYTSYLDTLKRIFKHVFEKTYDGRVCCVNLSNILIPRETRAHESKRIPLAFHFVSLMEGIGWKFLEDILWVKPEGAAKNRNGGFFQHRQPMAYKPNTVNEYILVFQKPSAKLIDAIVRSYDATTADRSKVNEGYERSNVWRINPETRSEHPAPYPVALVEKLIRYYSFIGDIVLDPFMGSGTTAVGAKMLNRQYLGYEIHKEYIDIATKRLETTVSAVLPPANMFTTLKTLDEVKKWVAKQQKRTLKTLIDLPTTTSKKELVEQIVKKWSSSH
jgi:DNA modification methylase